MNIMRISCVLCVTMCFLPAESFAKSKSCSAGEFLFSTKCRDCPIGCYCAGGDLSSLDPDDNLSANTLASYCAGSTSECYTGNSKFTKDKSEYSNWSWGACGRQDAAKIYRCPDGYTSNSNSTAKSECYFKSSSGDTVYYTARNCSAGTYLPAKSGSCQQCTKGEKDYCPGVSNVYPSPSKPQGVSTCENGKQPNNDRTACVEIAKNEPKKQTQTNKKTKIHCESGEYLKADTEKCVECSGSAKYCPGGDFNKLSKDQGIFNCPNGGRANKDKSACTITFTKKQMQECWIYSGDSDMYKECLFKNNKKTNEQNIKKDTLILKNINTELLKKDLKIPKQNIKIDSNLNNSVLKNKL